MVLLWMMWAQAHRFDPALVELTETSEARWVVSIEPASGPAEVSVAIDCAGTLPADRPTAVSCPWTEVRVEGLRDGRTDAVVRVAPRNGPVQTRVLTESAPTWRVQAARSSGWFGLGMRHVLGGWDHLVFVLALLMTATRPASVVAAVTGFTVGHSASMATAALGGIALPSAPVEAAIAASVVWLGRQIVLGERSARLWAVATGFGLLHGLGFAGALAELSLPAEGAVTALLGFNVGVEAGQLAVLATVGSCLLAAARRWPHTTTVVGWVAGGLGTAWLLRSLTHLGGV